LSETAGIFLRHVLQIRFEGELPHPPLALGEFLAQADDDLDQFLLAALHEAGVIAGGAFFGSHRLYHEAIMPRRRRGASRCFCQRMSRYWPARWGLWR
jgi:hypothetical protein